MRIALRLTGIPLASNGIHMHQRRGMGAPMGSGTPSQHRSLSSESTLPRCLPGLRACKWSQGCACAEIIADVPHLIEVSLALANTWERQVTYVYAGAQRTYSIYTVLDTAGHRRNILLPTHLHEMQQHVPRACGAHACCLKAASSVAVQAVAEHAGLAADCMCSSWRCIVNAARVGRPGVGVGRERGARVLRVDRRPPHQAAARVGATAAIKLRRQDGAYVLGFFDSTGPCSRRTFEEMRRLLGCFNVPEFGSAEAPIRMTGKLQNMHTFELPQVACDGTSRCCTRVLAAGPHLPLAMPLTLGTPPCFPLLLQAGA